jgi:hypothetical protein
LGEVDHETLQEYDGRQTLGRGGKMNIFIIWSGKTSKAIAEAFRDWLPQVIQEVKPWMSAKDIDKGAHWPTELAENLEKVNFGIVCLTPDNLQAPWILFESGATSKAVGETHVSPYLFELKSTDLTGPLSLYQMTESNKGDTFELIKTINKAIGEKALKDEMLQKAFDVWWPEFEGKLEKIKEQAKKEQGDVKPPRSDSEKLDELLQIVRLLSREQKEQLEKRIDEQVANKSSGLFRMMYGGRGPTILTSLKRKMPDADEDEALVTVLKKALEENNKGKKED